jgi:hypothetical protein
MGIDEIIELNLEGFLDVISEKAGYPLLEDIDWSVVKVSRGRGHAKGVILKVRGYADVEDKDESPAG